MTQSYRDEILDLLADGNARTVEEIREAIGATQGARIHQVMAELVTHTAIHRELYPVKKTKWNGLFYYRREGIEAKPVKCSEVKCSVGIPRGNGPLVDWSGIEVGEYRDIEGRTVDHVCSLACRASKRTGFRYSCRTIEGKVRVYRIS